VSGPAPDPLDDGLAYEVVDVFTDRPFAGNPLAVVLDADDLPTASMQALAQEFGLSETAFPVAPDDGADYRLRIFTPTTELPFAGHPSVGAAAVLARLGRIAPGPAVQQCGAGLLPVEVAPDRAVLTAGAPVVGGPVDPAPLLDAVGLREADLAGPAGRAGCGIDFTYLLVRPDAVARAEPGAAALRRLDLGTGVSVTSWGDGAAHSRVFVPEVGVAEDPATGSAAVGLAVHLAAHGLLGSGSYVVRQGEEVGRPSTMRCGVEVDGGRAVRVTVAGDVVPIARGLVRRPR
jgi:trans-2,3-dihydro-3-hydroxyanthranilate isomerase